MADQPNNQLNIEISEEVAEGTYANLAIITHSHVQEIIKEFSPKCSVFKCLVCLLLSES